MTPLPALPSPWSTALPDWENRLLTGQSLVPDLPLFRDQADLGLRIFKRLRIPDVYGMPTMAQACGDWFFPIVEVVFGSYDVARNRRMIQEYFWLIPKKNSKSSNGGALMLVALIMNRRPQGEFLFIGPTKELADIAFKQAKGTIKADPELEKLFHIQDHIRRITHRRTEATLQVKAADTDVITGSKALGTMIDETHVFAKRPRAAEVFLELRGALTARTDGFLFQTTTQSKEPPAGVFKAELQTARNVRDGKMQFPMLPILYELPEGVSRDGGWKARELWGYVNPNLGRSVDVDFLARELLKAEEQGAPALALLASQHFNVEIGLALRTDGWAGAEFWRENPQSGASNIERGLTLDAIIARSEVIVVGIDGGGLDDLLGLAVLGREIGTGRYLLHNHAWAHEIVKERRKEIAARLSDFAALGQLTFVKNPGDDVAQVADIVFRLEAAGLLAEKEAVGVDSHGVADIVRALTRRAVADEDAYATDGASDDDEVPDDDAIAQDRIVGVPQGWQLTGAIKTAERQLAGGTIVHAGLELMDFVVGNARVESRGNAVVITKQASGTAKIDPLIATLNAIVLMGRNPTAIGRSVFEDLASEDAASARTSADDEGIDPQILANPLHPRWREMRDRYEARFDQEEDD